VLLKGLTEAERGSDTLLDRTMVLYGTCMGMRELALELQPGPVLLAGGRVQARAPPGGSTKDNNYR